jgi:hypothetical protein
VRSLAGNELVSLLSLPFMTVLLAQAAGTCTATALRSARTRRLSCAHSLFRSSVPTLHKLVFVFWQYTRGSGVVHVGTSIDPMSSQYFDGSIDDGAFRVSVVCTTCTVCNARLAVFRTVGFPAHGYVAVCAWYGQRSVLCVSRNSAGCGCFAFGAVLIWKRELSGAEVNTLALFGTIPSTPSVGASFVVVRIRTSPCSLRAPKLPHDFSCDECLW